MRIEVDLGPRRGYGLCARRRPGRAARAELEEAALMCPTQAIRLSDD